MRQIKVRVKSNDNERVEEWWPIEQVLGGLANDLLSLIAFQGETIELLTEWNTRLQACIKRLETSFKAVAIDQNNRIEQLEDKVERLEQVIIGLSNGICSTYPDSGPMHTHEVYVTNGVRDLVKEIELQEWERSKYVGEEEEPNGARFREKEITEEEIRETAWILCKGYDVGSHRRDKAILTNFVSTKLEDMFGSEVENLYRADWLEEVTLFCEKYGYDSTHEEAGEMNEPHEEPDDRLFDAVDDLLYDAETNSYPLGQFNAEYLDALREVFLLTCRERAGIPTLPNLCPRCNGRMPPGDTLCVECESELAEEQATCGLPWEEMYI